VPGLARLLTPARRRPFASALLEECAAASGARVAPGEAAYALQPSGAAALAAATAALALQPWQAAPAAAVLAARGSASGAGALMALAALLDSAALRPARGSAGRGASKQPRPRHALALALGPGITAEGLVLELP
jgi:predicted naringenin-chalcone synthase